MPHANSSLFPVLVLAGAFTALFALGEGEPAGGTKRLVVGDVPEHTVGAYRPFTIPGEIDEADGFTELRQGRSITIWCPERVAREAPEKAAAAKRFVDSPFLPIGSVSVGYVGNASGESVLKELGVRYSAHGPGDVYDLEKKQVIVLGPGTDALFRGGSQVEALKAQLKTHMLLVLPGADLSLLPFGLARKTTTLPMDASSTTTPDLPLFAGTSRDFRDFVDQARGTEVPVLDGGPSWTMATSPACIAHVKDHSHSIVVFALAPQDAPAAARPALIRVWCTILANLNIESGT